MVCHSTKYFKKQLHKEQNLDQIVWNKVFEILGNLPYHNFFYAKAFTKIIAISGLIGLTLWKCRLAWGGGRPKYMIFCGTSLI